MSRWVDEKYCPADRFKKWAAWDAKKWQILLNFDILNTDIDVATGHMGYKTLKLSVDCKPSFLLKLRICLEGFKIRNTE